MQSICMLAPVIFLYNEWMWWHVCSYADTHISAFNHTVSNVATGHISESGANTDKGLFSATYSPAALHLLPFVYMFLCVHWTCKWGDMWCSYAFLPPSSWIILQPPTGDPKRARKRDGRANEKCRRKYAQYNSRALCMCSMCTICLSGCMLTTLMQGTVDHYAAVITEMAHLWCITKEKCDYGDVRKHTCMPCSMFEAPIVCLLLTIDKLQLAALLPEKMMKADSILWHAYFVF